MGQGLALSASGSLNFPFHQTRTKKYPASLDFNPTFLDNSLLSLDNTASWKKKASFIGLSPGVVGRHFSDGEVMACRHRRESAKVGDSGKRVGRGEKGGLMERQRV
jgi:hypothetical protein